MNQVQTSGNEIDKTRTQGKFKLFNMDNFLISLERQNFRKVLNMLLELVKYEIS